MIKRQLNPLRIGKGLLCLLALFMMLLAPQGAWAQDPVSYGLTVAGVEVTSANATNITGQTISEGTVTYEDGSHTLTLDHATINGSVVVTGGFDLVVCLVGDNTIQGTGETSLANGISRGGGSTAGKLTFTKTESSSGNLFFSQVTTPIAGFANIEYLNELEWGCRVVDNNVDDVEGVGSDVALASIGANLYVTKTKTTMTLSNNGGTVTYRKDDTLGHVLTLSGLTDLNNGISWYSPDNVTIEISGTNIMSFSSNGVSNFVCFEGNSQSNISFSFTGLPATLKLYDRGDSKKLSNPWIRGFKNASNPTLSDGLKMVEIDEYRYDSQDNQTKHVERYITTETYGLNVKGIQVHHLDGVLVGHKDNILGLVYNEQSEKWELSTSVTFNSDDNILTLNNANINYDDGNAIVSSITTPLTVYLTGENSISSGSYLPFEGAIGDDANLVFTTNTTGTPGSLTMTSTHTDFGPTSFFDGFKQILYPEEQGLLAAKSVNGNVVISQETGYGLKVAGIVVTEDNASHILGESNTSVTFTPATPATETESAKPATLTLNSATIPGVIETSIDLTVDFKGASSINLPSGDDYAFVGNKSTVLSFTNSGKNSTPLTVNGDFNGGNTNFMKDFADGSVDVDINNGRDNATVWWLESTISSYMYLRWIEKYDLWIGDTQFTNIDSELSGGKGSFDGDHTLTLNGASLTAPIKSNLDNLTIKLKGNNSIVETSDSATLINSYKKTATLSFDVDNELGGSLTLTNRGDGSTIKNFASVSLAEGLYIHSNQAGLRYETINNEKCYVAQQYGESWTMTINQNASYPIWVYKNSTDGYVQITGTNKDNVLGEQTDTKSVTYNDGTLTLNGATINSGDNYAFVMGDNMTALNVVLVGVNTVTGNGFQFTTSPASLKFKTNGTDAGSLAIVDAQNTNYSLATTTVEGENVTTAYENGLVYNSTNKTVSVVSYGLTVAGTAVTNANMGNVLGDGTVSFALAQDATETTPATPATLTLNGADISDNSISYSGAEDLTIAIKDNNQVFSINYNGNENDIPELTITKASGATNCSLALNSKGDGCVISGFSSVTWTGLNTKATTSTSIEYNTSGRYLSAGGEAVTDVIFTTAEVYPLWVGGTQVDSDNANHILGESNTSVTFTPATPATETESAKPATLTLNNATFTADGDHAIESGLENLTVFLVGKNYITKTGNSNYVFSKTSELEGATITITTDAESNGSLYITSLGDYLFGTGVTPVYTNVTIKNNGDNHTIDSNLGISVGGVPVTLFNSTDVFGDGTVSFTPAVPVTDNTPAVPAILTLNGATIECDEEQESPGIVYENEDDLTIALIGNNSIQGAAGCTAIKKRYGVETPKLYFAKGDATQNFSLTLIADREDGWIDGFEAIDGDFFVFDNEDDGTYTRTISSSVYGGTGTADEPFLIKTPEDLKNFAYQYNEGYFSRNVHVRLNNNIDCKDLEGFTTIADNSDATFMGMFDGNDKTISNLTMTGMGLFGYVEKDGDYVGTIKDLTLSGLQLTGEIGEPVTGGIVTYLYEGAVVSNCTVVNSTIACVSNAYNPNVAAIVAQMSGATVTGCTVNNVQVKAETTYSGGSGAEGVAGGIVASASGGTISSCVVRNGTKITDYYADEAAALCAGAIVGKANETTLTGNYYYYDVTVEMLNGTDVTNKIVKSGYTQRAIGGTKWNEQTQQNEEIPDLFEDNGAVMYTQTVALPGETAQASVMGEEDTYYSTAMVSDALAYLVAPGQTVTLNATPGEGYVITALTATNTTTEATISTSSENLGDNITQYTFIMPDAPVTVTLTAAQTMGIRVAGVEVTELNADDVLGDGKVSFTPAGDGPATLTLNNATINGRIFSSLQGGLTVYLLGSNIIDGGYVENNTNQPGDIAFVTEGENVPLTFTTNKTTPGLLLMKNTARYEGNAKYYQGFTESLESGLVSTSNDNKCLIAKAPVVEPGEGIHWTDQTYTISGLEGATIKYKDYLGKISETTYNEPFGIQNTGKYYLGIWQTLTVAETEFDLYSNNVNYIVHNKPTFSLSTENVYESPAELKLENLPTDLATTIDTYPQVWYYFGENVEDSVQYTSAEQTIAVSESTKVCVYILDEDSDKIYKSKTVEAEYDVRASAGLSYIDTQTAKPVELVQYTIGGEDNPTLPMLTNESELPVSFSSSETDVATIDEEGNVTIVGVGLTRITATTEMTEDYVPGEATYDLIVYKDLSHESIQVTVEDVVFDGESKTPADFITVTDGNYELTYNEDYRISSPEGSVTNVGSYTITIEGDLDDSYYVGSKQVTFKIVNRTLADNEVTFYNNWATYYSAVGDVMLPTDKNIGAFVATGIGDGVVSVSQISYIPEGVAVLLNNATETVATEAFDVEEGINLLQHANAAVVVSEISGTVYGLYNGTMMRVSGTIPKGRNYLVVADAVGPQGASQLTIVIDGEGNFTSINDVRSKTAETGADFYDMQGRKVQKPSKKGLYISNGRKVVVK